MLHPSRNYADEKMDEYVTKPLRRGDLLASIAKVLTSKIPGTNIPVLTGTVAGLPAISPFTGTPLALSAGTGLAASSSIARGLTPSPSASIVNIPDDKPESKNDEKTT
jgi:hypothetical protein